MSEVDDIWAEMQAEFAAPQKSTGNISSLCFNKEKPKIKGTEKKIISNVSGSLTKISTTTDATASASSGKTSSSAAKGSSRFAWLENWNYGIAGDRDSKTDDTSTDEPVDDSEATSAKEEEDLSCLNADPINENVPLDSPEAFISHLQRDINILDDFSSNLQLRIRALKKMDLIIVQNHSRLSSDILDMALEKLLKPLLKRIQRDTSEKVRQMATIILRTLIELVPTVGQITLQYLVPILEARMNCQDIDGVANIPEQMRPNPEQRPTEITKIVETSEEVRKELTLLIRTFVSRLSLTQVLAFVDEIVNMLRAMCMDPFVDIKLLGCEIMTTFCYNNRDMLLHFCVPMGRSITSCLMHNHCRLRIAAIQCLTAVLFTGTWKHSHEVVQYLIAWEDPNQVPIKAFYEQITKVNYWSSLTFDRHPSVRRFWFETLGYWLLRLPDHVDHEPHIFPYILSGLFDENEEIALETFWLLEACGAAYEVEHESEIRDARQYGLDAEWTYTGHVLVPFPLQGKWGKERNIRKRFQACGPDFAGTRAAKTRTVDADMDTAAIREDESHIIELPDREYAWPELSCLYISKRLPRPRLGARMWVRTHVRRFIKALFNNVLDFRECNMLNASKLLIMCVAYAEDGITEWLGPLLEALTKFYSGKAYMAGSRDVAASYDVIAKLLGSYLDPNSLYAQVEHVFKFDTVFYLEQRLGMFHILFEILDGAVQSLEKMWLLVQDEEREGKICETKYKVTKANLWNVNKPKDASDRATANEALDIITERQKVLRKWDLSDGPDITDKTIKKALDDQGRARVNPYGLGRLAFMIPMLVEQLFACDLVQECQRSSSEGLPVAETLWNLMVMLSRVSRALSFEQRSKLLMLAVALFTGIGGSDSVIQESGNASGGSASDNISAVAKGFIQRSGEIEFGAQFVDLVTCPVLATAKGMTGNCVRSMDNADDSDTFTQLTPLESFQLLSARLDVKIEDICDGMVKFGTKNFFCFKAFAHLVPIGKIVESPQLWECLRSFTLESEEVQTRMECFELCISLLQKESAFYRKEVQGKTATIDMDDIDCDDDDQYFNYEKNRSSFINHLLMSFVPIFDAAIRKELDDCTPYFIVVQTIALLRSLVSKNFTKVECMISNGGKVDEEAASLFAEPEEVNDLIIHFPVELYDSVTAVVTDVEYYKRVHKSIEKQERLAMGKNDCDDIATMKQKEIRESSIEKSVHARAAAAELLLLMLRSHFHSQCVAMEDKNLSDKKRSFEEGFTLVEEPDVKNLPNSPDLNEGGPMLPAAPTSVEDVESESSKKATEKERLVTKSSLLVVSNSQDHPLLKLRHVFHSIRILLKQKHEATLQPHFVRPTPPALLLFAAETLRLFISSAQSVTSEVCRPALVEDAARQILKMKAANMVNLDKLAFAEVQENFVVADAVIQLMDMNLSLPPNPNEPLTPIVASKLRQEKKSLGLSGQMETTTNDADYSAQTSIPIGWLHESEEREIESQKKKGGNSSGKGNLGNNSGRAKALAGDISNKLHATDSCSDNVILLMQQSEECLRWNAALGLYRLVADCSKIDPSHLVTAMCRWENEGKQGRTLLAKQLLATLGMKIDGR